MTARLTAIAMTALLALAPAAGAAEAPFAGDGAWCWFQDPRAVYHQGEHRRTYAGYVTAAGDVAVASYDHDAHELRHAVVAPAFQRDDHASPALHVLRDGRLMVLWSAHGGRQLYVRVTRRPEDVFEWDDTRAIGTNAPGHATYTYANPVQVGGRLHLFWRAGTGTGTAGQAAFTYSDDEGATWAPGRLLIQNPGQRPYVKYDGAGDTIHVAFTEGHPNSAQTGILYAAYRGGRLHRADGTLLGDPPLPAASGERVYGAVARAWVWDVAADAQGRPAIVYATFPTKADHRYRYARWDGTRWIDVELARAGGTFVSSGRESQYSGGIALDHDDPSTVYLSRPVNGVFEIERWRTPDGGRTWARTAVTAGSSANNVRPVVPRGARPSGEARVLWMNGPYPGYTTFATSIRSVFDRPPAAIAAPPPAPQTPPPAPEPAPGEPEPGGPAPPQPDPPPPVQPRPSAEPEGPRTPALTITTSRAIVLPGRRVRIAGTMRDSRTGEALDGRMVHLYARVRGSRRWRRVAYARGRVALKRMLRRLTDFRLVYRGSPLMTWAGSPVARVYVELPPDPRRSGRD